MQCPQCGHQQLATAECESCGIVFSKWKPHEAVERSELPSPLEALLGSANVLKLNENPRGLLAVLTGWEVAREFDIVDSVGREKGSVAEQGRGLISSLGRTFMSSWLPVQFAVYSYPSQQLAMTLHRPFFWLFSEITVEDAGGRRLGSTKRGFSILRKRYDLRDASGMTFATIVTPLLHPWTFQIFDRSGQQRAEITKRWAGAMAEIVTEAQRFKIDFMNHPWPLAQRAVILATALTIDFDAFESRYRHHDD
ncbi:MAG: phospholipid scramblase family protein [Acidobacteriota bacterium]|nr:phospholipid scramblase family protein [Acidobacteriota bacterium]